MRPLIINKFKEVAIRKTRYPISNINRAINLAYTLLITSKLIPNTFHRILSKAYNLNYNMPNIIVFLPGIASYSEKASFLDE